MTSDDFNHIIDRLWKLILVCMFGAAVYFWGFYNGTQEHQNAPATATGFTGMTSAILPIPKTVHRSVSLRPAQRYSITGLPQSKVHVTSQKPINIEFGNCVEQQTTDATCNGTGLLSLTDSRIVFGGFNAVQVDVTY